MAGFSSNALTGAGPNSFSGIAGGIRNITQNLSAGFAQDPAVQQQQAQSLLYQDQQRQQQAAQRIQALTENFKVYAQAVQGMGKIPPALQKAIDQNAQLLQASGASPEEVQAMLAQVEGFAQLPGAEADPFTLSPGQTRYDASGNPIVSAPEGDPEYVAKLQAAEQQLGRPLTEPEKQRLFGIAPPAGTNVNIYNQAVSQPEKQALGYADRVELGMAVLDEVARGGYEPTNVEEGLGKIPVIGRSVTSEAKRRFDDAADDITRAINRKESGAVISEEEQTEARRLYIPVPGDTPQILADKKQRLIQQLNNLRREGRPVTGGEATETANKTKEQDDPLGIR